ncbi:MAG: FKBP-type peptidyl-prolyl cis-trans isomerase [Bacteroidales bacterium]
MNGKVINSTIKILIILYCFLFLNISFGQTKKQIEFYANGSIKSQGKIHKDLHIGIHKSFFENGKINAEVVYNRKGVLLKYKKWDIYGNLLISENYSKLYKEYPKKKFSNIKWEKITDDVFIFKDNEIDTNIVVSDSSKFSAYYQCYLLNGNLIDNNFTSPYPLQSSLDLMIEGFRIGVKQMHPGEIALIKIESNKAYGNKVTGNVPAGSGFVYLVYLLSVD